MESVPNWKQDGGYRYIGCCKKANHVGFCISCYATGWRFTEGQISGFGTTYPCRDTIRASGYCASAVWLSATLIRRRCPRFEGGVRIRHCARAACRIGDFASRFPGDVFDGIEGAELHESKSAINAARVIGLAGQNGNLRAG